MLLRWGRTTIHRGLPTDNHSLCIVRRKIFNGVLKMHIVVLGGPDPVFWSRRKCLEHARPFFEQWEEDMQREATEAHVD
ncbi:MAG: hypothetical protein KA472_11380 [Pseudomonadales bacterium]|nr:hypothetical protein [Pseudomonadales bacterium]